MLTVCMAFYSPSGYWLPQEYLAATLAWLHAAGAPVVLAQVVKSGQQPQPVTPNVRSLVYKSDDALFFKENLWNLAATSCTADKLLFLDSDVRFSRDDIAALTETALDQHDVIQPFETAIWLDRDGDPFLCRRSAAYGLCHAQEPSPGTYHPGFSWAMTRSAFDRLGGFYCGHPFGGGDVAFSYSLDARWLNNRRTEWLPDDTICWHSAAFQNYQRRGVDARLKLGYLSDIEVYHRWHGDTVDRQYTTRCTYLPIKRGEEYPMYYRPDGLLAWNSPEAAAAAQRYFDSRREDG